MIILVDILDIEICSVAVGLRTRLGTLQLGIAILPLLPRLPIPTDKPCNALGIDLLPIHPERRLLSPRRAFLLLPNHQLDLLGFDILADVPGSEAVFVLFFSGEW